MDPRGEAIAAFVRRAAHDGVRFHHQGRIVGPGGGTDCVGLVVMAERAAGLECNDREAYPARASVADLVVGLEGMHVRVPVESAKVGDVVLWNLEGDPHVGIVLGRSTVDGREMVGHAYRTRNRVVVHAMAGPWRTRVHSAWRNVGLA